MPKSKKPKQVKPGAGKGKVRKGKGKKDKRKRASFGHSSKGRGMLKSQKKHYDHDAHASKEDVVENGSCDVPTMDDKILYKGYDISMLPKEAHPDPLKENKGLHSYTLRNSVGDATIEVLLKHGAYFIKKVSARGNGGGVGQVSMKVHGADLAWSMAKHRAGFDS